MYERKRRLLRDFPEYKLLWPQFRSISDSLIITADAIKQHGVLYMAGLKTIINSMENEESLARAISRIAIAHLKWHICKNHIMNMVQEVIVILQSYHQCGGKFMEEAWFTLFDVIGNLIDKFSEERYQNIDFTLLLSRKEI
ncbi:hypothetical protein DINM_001917 [Dirofilaria immitis]|nr:hypothetical protein [Dirofilaria immitis]